MKKKYLFFPLIAFLGLSYFDIPNRAMGCEQNYAPNIDTTEEKPMVVVIASYNNKNYFKHNLDSVFSQKYTNFRVIYTSDASTDGTADLVREYVKEKGVEDKFTLLDNKINKGACYNYYSMINSCKKEEIVCILDGDDALSHRNVLTRVNRAYSSDKVWMTYGGVYVKDIESDKQLETNSNQEIYKFGWNNVDGAVTSKVLKNRQHRFISLRFVHLRTFYAGLFQSIPKVNFIENGAFYKTSWDVASALFLVDRAGDHVFYISDSLYEYNMDNPLNDFRIGKIKQLWTSFSILFRKKLEPFSSKEDFLGSKP